MKSYPPNIDFINSAPIESLYLHTSRIFNRVKEAWGHNDVCFECSVSRSMFEKLPNFHQEFGIDCELKWGTHSKESEQLAYAIVRFITNDEETTRLLYKQFLYRYVLLWSDHFSYTFYELQRMIINISIIVD